MICCYTYLSWTLSFYSFLFYSVEQGSLYSLLCIYYLSWISPSRASSLLCVQDGASTLSYSDMHHHHHYDMSDDEMQSWVAFGCERQAPSMEWAAFSSVPASSAEAARIQNDVSAHPISLQRWPPPCGRRPRAKRRRSLAHAERFLVSLKALPEEQISTSCQTGSGPHDDDPTM